MWRRYLRVPQLRDGKVAAPSSPRHNLTLPFAGCCCGSMAVCPFALSATHCSSPTSPERAPEGGFSVLPHGERGGSSRGGGVHEDGQGLQDGGESGVLCCNIGVGAGSSTKCVVV